MSRTANLVLVRHAQSDWNAAKRIQGSQDRPLDELGRQQAQELSQQLSTKKLGAIYSSPLRRARETAEFIRSQHACELQIDAALREGAFGSIEGMTWDEYYSRYAKQIEERAALPLEQWLTYKILPDCESSGEIAERALACLKRICRAHPGETAVVVTHGFVIRALLISIADFGHKEVHISNTSMVELVGDGVELTILSYQGLTIGS